MPSNTSPADVARELRTSLATSGRASRRMRSLTFWRMFGVERRTPASVQRIVDALAVEGLVASVIDDALGSEGRLAWITVALVEPVRPPLPSHVDFGAGEAQRQYAAANETASSSEPASVAAPQAHVPGAVVPTYSSWAGVQAFGRLHPIPFLIVLGSLFSTATGGRVGPFLVIAFLIWAARSDLFGSRGFATRHPIAISLMLLGASALIVDRRLEALVAIACIVWVARAGLDRAPQLAAQLPSIDATLNWANENRIGVAVTSAVALLALTSLWVMIGGQEPAANRSARSKFIAATEAPAVAPDASGIVSEATPSAAPMATLTIQPTSTRKPATPTVRPPTATSPPPTATRPAPTATNPPPPPTMTPVPMLPAARPPIDIDPNRNQVCDSFPNYESMKAFRDYWQARGVPNPGRLDGDRDGLACEAGEGGRPPAPTMTPSGWPLKHGITLWEDDATGEGIRILAEVRAGTICTPLAGTVRDCCPGLAGAEYWWHFSKMKCGPYVGWAAERDLIDWR